MLLSCFSIKAQTSGVTYSYDFADGSVFPQNSTTYDEFETPDGFLSMNKGEGSQFYFNDATHGVDFKDGNYFDIMVAGNATITFTTCQYSADGGVLTFTDANDSVLGVIDAEVNGGVDGTPFSFNYVGDSAIITATLTTSGSNYIHGVNIANDPEVNPGETYAYDFADGTVFPQDETTYDSFSTADGVVYMDKGEGSQFYFNDGSHGVDFKNGNFFEIAVAGNATISFTTCQYSADGGTLTFKDSNENVIGVIDSEINGGTDGTVFSFDYIGPASTITATLATTGSNYIHGLSITNDEETVSNGLVDVWDFGAEQLDADTYNNRLTETEINGWYDEAIAPGTSGNIMPATWTAGLLTWVGGSNDRLRTANTNLTRYDENLSGVSDYSGRLYVNAGGATSRYMSLTLNADDEVKVYMLTQSGTGNIHFENSSEVETQDNQIAVGSTLQELNFVAQQAGVYHIYDEIDKPSYYRIERKDATYVSLSGLVDETSATGISNGYAIGFTNEAGKLFTATVENGAYSIEVPAGYLYNLSLIDANGFIINNGTTLTVEETTSNYNIVISAVEIYNLSGNITGLDNLSGLGLAYTPDPSVSSVYVPIVSIDFDNSTYSVDLEPGVAYTITATGVNDYEIPTNTVTIGAALETQDLVFIPKPLYDVVINTTGLNEAQQDALALRFINLNEEGYTYTFSDISNVALRDGTYTVESSGLDLYPLKQELASNLTVNGANTSKDIAYNPITEWLFNDRIINAATAYEGLIFTGSVNVRGANGDLNCGSGSTVAIPVQVGDKVIITDYYASEYSVEGEATVSNTSNSTGTNVVSEYVYTGTSEGMVTISVISTSYFVSFKVVSIVPYSPIITVGVDKDYQTINEALDAISRMDRPNDEPVSVVIDPGNYEEMLVIESNNITLKNASSTPSIALLNQGVDIDPNAVRITSYYGQKYNFFSQGTNNKWSAEALAVNTANGYTEYINQEGTGGGSSYWNATIVVKAIDFTMEDIIIENSFNQYISSKESQDVVQAKALSEPVRPSDYGNTSVQDRSQGYVTQAAALGLASGADRVFLDECRVIGRQDSFYGGQGVRFAAYKGVMMGAVDYIFGEMTAVFYESDLVLNTSDFSSDAAYITAAKQSSGRGYLMFECHVKSPIVGLETASTFGSKPGYFGRPWEPNTSEVVFYNTTIDESTYPGSEGLSLISPVGWTSSLGGESTMMYEYGTIENAIGVDNAAVRAPWSTVLTSPTLTDGTEINTFNFTKGNDDWDPFQAVLSVNYPSDFESSVVVKAYDQQVHVSNVLSNTSIKVYSITGALVKELDLSADASFDIADGIWIIKLNSKDGIKVVKLLVH